jgi:hypothetical protein
MERKALSCRPSEEATESEVSSKVERAKILVGNKNEAKQCGKIGFASRLDLQKFNKGGALLCLYSDRNKL